MKILVLGGKGFIGRHVVRELSARGHFVVLSTRNRECDQPAICQVLFQHLTEPGDWHQLLRGFDVAVNTVGILRERLYETYDAIHHRSPAALAQACAELGIRLIHVSALALHDRARSRFLLSKLAGERAIAASGADYTIVRPSLVDGEGGFGARWIRWLARCPVHITPVDARGRIAALDARDLGEAIAVLCERRGSAQLREVELGGIELMNLRDYLAAMRPTHLPPPTRIFAPAWMARVVSHLCDLAHFSPFSYGHLELLRRDNMPRENLLPALLARTPRKVGFGTPANRKWNPEVSVTLN
jgi:NADH dehydrogenase